MKDPSRPTSCSLLLLQATPPARARHSLKEAAMLAGIHPERIRYYCRLGLLGEARVHTDAVLVFDDDALYVLRHFEYYRHTHTMKRRTLRLLCSLWCEVERLRVELHFLRG